MLQRLRAGHAKRNITGPSKEQLRRKDSANGQKRYGKRSTSSVQIRTDTKIFRDGGLTINKTAAQMLIRMPNAADLINLGQETTFAAPCISNSKNK